MNYSKIILHKPKMEKKYSKSNAIIPLYHIKTLSMIHYNTTQWGREGK